MDVLPTFFLTVPDVKKFCVEKYILIKNELLYMSDISKTTINLPKDLKKELKKIAIDEETSLSGLIIKMIEEGMQNRNKQDVISDEDTI